MDDLTPNHRLRAIHCPEDLRRLPHHDLRAIADELRADLLHCVSQTGGHLGASLGVVELTVAVHYVFDTPRAKLIWDVAHQCYPHKMLTERRDRMMTMRQENGLAGFTCRFESEYDCFGAAHSSTAMSAGLGFAKARDMQNEDYDVVAIVGDGSMSAGMCFEALNNIGAEKTRLITILNDNHMSIDPAVGALAQYLLTLQSKMPDRATRHTSLDAGRLASFIGTRTLFDDLGVRYAGPFDGHDMDEMLAVLRLAKASAEPLLLHVVTRKGHGYAPAEAAHDKYHGVVKFDVATGKQSKSAPKALTYSQAFGDSLKRLASEDPRICALTPAMASGSGLMDFWKSFPDRFFDVGIAEQHAVTFAAGLAAGGMRPFCAIYSTFLQRGFDQVVHDVAIQNLPVRFAIDRAGMVGADGVTHQGAFDLAFLSCLPNMVIMAPADEAELGHMVATAAQYDSGPSAIRYPRGEGTGVGLPETPACIAIGRGRMLRSGNDVAILSLGTLLREALGAADDLAELGISISVADARFAKPVDRALIEQLVRHHKFVLCLEEGSSGGFAALVYQAIAESTHPHLAGRLRPVYLPDMFVKHASQEAQLRQAGLDRTHLVKKVLDLLPNDSMRERPIERNNAQNGHAHMIARNLLTPDLLPVEAAAKRAHEALSSK